MEKDQIVSANVNLNEKANYISFTSPVLKNKKGHSRQITKSVRNIKLENGLIDWASVNKYIEEIKLLISNFDYYYSDYKNYLEAKNNFSEFAMNAVFDGTEFSNKYNQESTKRLMENTINLFNGKGRFLLNAVLLAGVSAGGKTTTEKHMIGSTDTSFPATTQANTTVGLLYAMILNAALAIKGAARFTTRASLEDRIKFALIDITKKNLSGGHVDVYNSLFEALTIFGDRKCKLQYIISVNDLKDLDLERLSKDASIEIWDRFKKEIRKSNSDIEISEEFHLNSDNRVLIEFGDFIMDQINDDKDPIRISQLFNLIVEMISNRVRKVVQELIKSFLACDVFEKTIISTITVVDENRVHNFDNQHEFSDCELELIKYPKFISIEVKYSNGDKPDKALRNYFFRNMEFISSASEEKEGQTLFPIVEEMRIYGNFRPLWVDDKETMDDYILIDSEGLGHDMSQEGISIELRDLISQCKNIVFVQNGSEAIGNEFADALGLLISTGSVYKTKFCFNRMEKFDQKSNDKIESRIAFVKSGIVNAIKKNVEREVELQDKIVTGKEYVYERVIVDQSLYFEHLGQVIESDSGIVPLDMLGSYKALKELYDTQENEILKEQIFNAMIPMHKDFNAEFNPVSNINKLIDSFSKTTEISKDDIRNIGFRPQYSLYKFTRLFINMNEEFASSFLNKVNSQVWQTVKAFNARIAWNYDSREWGNLRPESDYIGYAQRKIIAFLLNPENIDDERAIKDKGLFVQAISNMMANSLSVEFKKTAEKAIYIELLEDCWRHGISKEGAGSTFTRNRIINSQIDSAFHSTEKMDLLFREFRKIVFDNELMRIIKFELV